MLLSIEGDEATGKTTLAYSAPLPIVGFAFDMGVERAIFGGRFEELFAGLDILTVPYQPLERIGKAIWVGHDITVFELPTPIQLDTIQVKGCIEVWNYFLQLCADALLDPAIATVVIDTMTLARRLKINAYLQGLQANTRQGEKMREALLQIEYGKPNDAIRDIYNMAAGVKKNLAATHHLTDKYVSAPTGKDGRVESVPTGERILEGLNGTYRFVDVAVRMTKTSDKGKNPTLVAEMLKCGYNLDQEGTRMEGATWDSISNLISMATGERIQIGRRKEA